MPETEKAIKKAIVAEKKKKKMERGGRKNMKILIPFIK